jgi:hypothetical protein
MQAIHHAVTTAGISAPDLDVRRKPITEFLAGKVTAILGLFDDGFPRPENAFHDDS